ncbi:BT4734/BF3469 family protein [Parabacteroides sp. PF5-9]|uniref:BT4734/BF3469 family protein n=1 Tax=Parabacteroides sp. PF5-9 TaxID=1742404 RepID=UPI00247485BE|nr:BT4734/BF3469 family protein [Parabacteroides sp. PF5-9]MDH6357617.1 hypothetical protein [Parabacteroides sp. PF5-9]
MKNILNTTVSFYRCNTDIQPKTQNLYDWLTSSEYKNVIEKIRNCTNDDKVKKLKSKLPAVTPSGLFLQRNANGLIRHSGFICIDIDGKDNVKHRNFDRMKEFITVVPYVAYCGLSASGMGYFCIIPIARPDKHREHFLSLQEDFARCGVTIDNGCKDICRLRYASYDPKPYINLNAKTYTYVWEPQHRRDVRKGKIKPSGITAKEVTGIISVIETKGIDITGDYHQWWEIGCALANEFGESGRGMFHSISQFGDYDPDITDDKFDEALKGYDFSIGTFFHYAKLYGVDAIMDFQEYLK